VTFVEALRSGANPDIEDWVDRWHDAHGSPHDREIGLREYLGFTEEQYWRWLVVGDEVLAEIVDGDA
jgi:hypothetical protein